MSRRRVKVLTRSSNVDGDDVLERLSQAHVVMEDQISVQERYKKQIHQLANEQFDDAGLTLQKGRYAKFSGQKSFGLMTQDNSVRRACMWLVTWMPFDIFILVVILINVGLIAANEPLTPNAHLASVEFPLELTFQLIYTLEAIIKLIAMGVVMPRRSYFRNGWNILDFALVILGWVSMIPGVANLVIFRSLRIFRAVRSFGVIQGLKAMMTATLYSLRGLLNVSVLLVFLFFLFGLIGLQFFSGSLHQRCYDDISGAEVIDNVFQLCSNSSLGRLCANGTTCLAIAENPLFGKVGFDNIGAAMLTLFGSMTTDGWAFSMYFLQEALGWPTTIYYVIYIILAGFFVVNLVLAVVVDEFSAARTATAEKERLIAEYAASTAHLETKKPVSKAEKWARGCLAASREKPTQPVLLWFNRVVTSKPFEITFALIIVLNTITLLFYHYQMTEGWVKFLEYSNYVFTGLFILEMVLKVIGLGIRGYLFDGWNLFDFLVVALSIAELFLTSSVALAFRALRLLRLFRLARTWKKLQNILRVTLASLPNVIYLTAILSVFILVFAVVARDLFAGTRGFEGDLLPRANFDDLGTSVITTFTILTGDSWTAIMYSQMAGAGDAAVLWFIVWVLVGGLMMVNLWVAIILAGFDGLDDLDEEDDGAIEVEAIPMSMPRQKPVENKAGDMIPLPNQEYRPEDFEYSDESTTAEEEEDDAEAAIPEGAEVALTPRGTAKLIKASKKTLRGKSFMLFDKDNLLRIILSRIVWSPAFEWSITALILANLVFLALDNVLLDRTSALGRAIDILEIIFNVAFTIEMLMKWVVMGFVAMPGAYWRSGWDVVDGLIVIVSWATFPFDIGFFRAFRAARALRILGKFPNTRVVVWAILQGFKQALNVAAVSLLFWIIFGVLGVQLWQGQLYSCSDPSIAAEVNCTGFWDPTLLDSGNSSNLTSVVLRQLGNASSSLVNSTLAARVWQNPPWNFDHFGWALLTLFQVAIGVSWIDVGWSTQDIVGVGVAPQFNHDPSRIIFFFVFHIVMTFFILNLFIGAVIDAFTELKKSTGASPFLTKKQAEWVETQRVLQFAKPEILPRPSPNPVRRMVQKIILSKVFQYGIILCICANAVVIACTHYQMNARWTEVIDAFNYFFAAVFVVEAIMKIWGLGPRMYFRDAWNVFDFVIVLLTFLSIGLSNANLDTDVQLSGIRAFRLLRLLRLIRFLTPLRILWETITGSFLQVLNVMVCIFVVMFLFAIIGMSLLGSIEFGGAINEQNNFQTFGKALEASFRLLTTDTWCWVMFDAMNPALGGSPWLAIYFVAFIIMSNWVLLNVILAVLLDAFVDFMGLDQKKLELGEFSKLSRIYFHFDKYGEGRIKIRSAMMVLTLLAPPLGPTPSTPGFGSNFADMMRHLVKLNVHVTMDGYVLYSSLSRALTQLVLKVADGGMTIALDARESEFTMAEYAAATTLQRFYRDRIGSVFKKEKPRGLVRGTRGTRSTHSRNTSSKNSLRSVAEGASDDSSTGGGTRSLRGSAKKRLSLRVESSKRRSFRDSEDPSDDDVLSRRSGNLKMRRSSGVQFDDPRVLDAPAAQRKSLRSTAPAVGAGDNLRRMALVRGSGMLAPDEGKRKSSAGDLVTSGDRIGTDFEQEQVEVEVERGRAATGNVGDLEAELAGFMDSSSDEN